MADITYDQFEKRFIAQMVSRGAVWVEEKPSNPKFPDADCYGKQAAKATWDAIEQLPEPGRTERMESPEDEADTDMSYWEA